VWWASPTVVGVLALIHPRVGSRGPGGSWVWGCWVEHNGAAGTWLDTLLGPEETPWWVCSPAISGPVV
jgi:hypothetical protein